MVEEKPAVLPNSVFRFRQQLSRTSDGKCIVEVETKSEKKANVSPNLFCAKEVSVNTHWIYFSENIFFNLSPETKRKQHKKLQERSKYKSDM